MAGQRETPAPAYPPPLSPSQLSARIFRVKDYQLTHGMLLKYGADANSVSGVPVGVSLFPSPFPREKFDEARRLQVVFNRLYVAVSEDEEWLGRVLDGYVVLLFIAPHAQSCAVDSGLSSLGGTCKVLTSARV